MDWKKNVSVLALAAVLPFLGSALADNSSQRTEDREGYDKSRDMGTAAPEGADVLFDGTQESIDKNWQMWSKTHDAKDDEITWTLVKSPTDDTMVLMTNGGKTWGTHDLVTKKLYQDFEGHAEFIMMGNRGDDSPEGYSNSGVYLQNRYEIQIESPTTKQDKQDPYSWKIGLHGIGAFCMERVPDQNCWRDQGTWNSYHFIFKAARWDGETMLEPAHATVWWNGIKVHDNVPIKHANGGIPVDPSFGGLKLQEEGTDVRYRNVWVKEIKAE